MSLIRINLAVYRRPPVADEQRVGISLGSYPGHRDESHITITLDAGIVVGFGKTFGRVDGVNWTATYSERPICQANSDNCAVVRTHVADRPIRVVVEAVRAWRRFNGCELPGY